MTINFIQTVIFTTSREVENLILEGLSVVKLQPTMPAPRPAAGRGAMLQRLMMSQQSSSGASSTASTPLPPSQTPGQTEFNFVLTVYCEIEIAVSYLGLQFKIIRLLELISGFALQMPVPFPDLV